MLAAFRIANDSQPLEARREYYFNEFAKTHAFRENAAKLYAELPGKPRTFRAAAEALKNFGMMDELRQLIDVHVKNHPQDEYLHLYRAELHLNDEEFDLADKAFTKAFAAIHDQALENRFHYNRLRARFNLGEVMSAYREIGPRGLTFQQLAGMCWYDKNADELETLIDAHARRDPGDPELVMYGWRAAILAKRFDEAGKKAKAADLKNPAPTRNFARSFLYDMIDCGHVVEGYRHAPDPAEALAIIVSEYPHSN